MTALASPVSAYLADQIADELTLARLLGYKPEAPHEIKPNCTIWASKGTAFASFSGPGTRSNDKVWLPKWRRTNDAFELIALCEMMVSCTQRSVSVMCPGMALQFASFAEHSTKDDAIRAAMCKAAIAYLQAKQSKERGA